MLQDEARQQPLLHQSMSTWTLAKNQLLMHRVPGVWKTSWII
jgi:hypothetical protein